MGSGVSSVRFIWCGAVFFKNFMFFHEFHVFFHEFHVFLTHSCTHGDSSPEQKSRFSHELYVSFHEFDVVRFFREFHFSPNSLLLGFLVQL